jgi:hypothetical protein
MWADHHLLVWILRNSEVFGNILDLLSFCFVTPEIVGWARLKVIIDKPRVLLGAMASSDFDLWKAVIAAVLMPAIVLVFAAFIISATVFGKSWDPLPIFLLFIVTIPLAFILYLIAIVLFGLLRRFTDTGLLFLLGVLFFLISRSLGIAHGIWEQPHVRNHAT